jgi:hypothetical protein
MATDPMHMLGELNRVTAPGGTLILTTPNSVSWAALARAALGEQPYSWTTFFGIPGLVHRHNREYTPREVARLMDDSGFDIDELITFQAARMNLARFLASRMAGLIGTLTGRCAPRHRSQKILVRARKAGAVRRRFPAWLYMDPKLIADKLDAMGERGLKRRNEWKPLSIESPTPKNRSRPPARRGADTRIC